MFLRKLGKRGVAMTEYEQDLVEQAAKLFSLLLDEEF